MADNIDVGGGTKKSGLLRVSEAAVLLKVSCRTVWRLIADGELKAVRVRRCTRLVAMEVEQFVNRGVGVRAV
jgi:excisionase family DNA binding protein